MEHFSEIYGDCFRAVAEILTLAASRPVSEREIQSTAEQYAPGENALYILPRLLGGEWPLLRKNDDGTYSSVLMNEPHMPLSALQRAWLCSMLEDKRCAAFLDENERQIISRALDSTPLYDTQSVETVGASLDGDPFDSPEYASRLNTVLDAIRRREVLYIRYTGGKGQRVSGDFLPCRLEYSAKDNKLRMYAVFIRYGKVIFLATINLGRIEEIRPSREHFSGEVDIEQMRRDAREDVPAVIELTDQRNALERFMIQFSGYEKRTRCIDEEDKYVCSVFYDKSDETELLIRILSFGPVVRLVSPDSLVDKLRRRISSQWTLLNQ